MSNRFRKGIPSGVSWLCLEGGGWLVGNLDSEGECSEQSHCPIVFMNGAIPIGSFTGESLAFLYPDFSTALVSDFDR